MQSIKATITYISNNFPLICTVSAPISPAKATQKSSFISPPGGNAVYYRYIHRYLFRGEKIGEENKNRLHRTEPGGFRVSVRS